jgi:3-phosphoshikimate 1-carboxyvinyltransferase
MATELRKFGADVEEGPDNLKITPPPALLTPRASRLVPVSVDTYDDHRMAMCFSLIALLGTPVTIRDPACVRKTFPDYFDVFRRLVGPR